MIMNVLYMYKILKYGILALLTIFFAFVALIFIFKGTFCKRFAQNYVEYGAGIKKYDSTYAKGLTLAKEDCMEYSAWQAFQNYWVWTTDGYEF